MPICHSTVALLLQAVTGDEKASLLVKARRLAIAATSNAVAPSYLQARVTRGQPLPRVVLTPVMDDRIDEEEEGEEKGEEYNKLRTLVAFLLGVEGGPDGEGMPRDVFRVVLDLLMPSWDPLRRGVAGMDRPMHI